MPSFTITATGQQVALDKAGAGQAAFTVTNTTPQQFGGRLAVKPTDPAKPEWLKLAGEPLRQFAPNGTEQVVVAVDVPPGTAPGTYSFRVDVISEVHPDEDFTEGPTVSFVVEAQKEKKKFPIWIPIVALLVLVVAGVAAFFLLRDPELPAPEVSVPPDNQVFAIGEAATPTSVPVAWRRVKGADSYKVELAKCPTSCETDRTPVKADGTDQTVHILNFEPGANDGVTEWEVRVVAVSRKNTEGEPSQSRRFRFAAPSSGGGGVVMPPLCEGGFRICVPIGDQIVMRDLQPGIENLLETVNTPMVVGGGGG